MDPKGIETEVSPVRVCLFCAQTGAASLFPMRVDAQLSDLSPPISWPADSVVRCSDHCGLFSSFPHLHPAASSFSPAARKKQRHLGKQQCAAHFQALQHPDRCSSLWGSLKERLLSGGRRGRAASQLLSSLNKRRHMPLGSTLSLQMRRDLVTVAACRIWSVTGEQHAHITGRFITNLCRFLLNQPG